jgi:hypothetical protein
MHTNISPHSQRVTNHAVVVNPPQLPQDGPIGEELAREIVAWSKLNAPPVVAEVKQWLRTQSVQSEIVSSPQTLREIANDRMAPEKRGLTLGVLWVGKGGYSAIATVTLMRDGTIIWTKVRALH